MHLLGDREEIRRALNDPPFGLQLEAVHEQRYRRKHLGHSPAVIGRIEICDPQTFEFFGLIADAFDLYRADERFVVFDLLDAMLCHSN